MISLEEINNKSRNHCAAYSSLEINLILKEVNTAATVPSGNKIFKFAVNSAEIAQLVERRTENPCVPSSILGLGIPFL